MSTDPNDREFVKFKGIVKRYGEVDAVKKIDITISRGEFVTLLGPSGCGKTTLLRMIAGLETPTEGDIYIAGKRINDMPVHKRNLGMIFQNYALFPHKTIFDNVAFGLKYRNISSNIIKKKVNKALETVRLPGVEKRMPSQLSGGQQQRIALARAIVIEPDVLLMDEPLSALDESLREDMRREIGNIQQNLKVTTIFVTHDQREALSMSDKIIVMKNGIKQQEGSPEEVYNNFENHFVADFLGHSNFIDVTVSSISRPREENYPSDRSGENKAGGYTQVKLGDETLLLGVSKEKFEIGESVELVIRAQKLKLGYAEKFEKKKRMNYFFGKIIDISYMGGEVSYFVELYDKKILHVIDFMKRAPFRRDDEVFLKAVPENCKLLKKP